MFAPLSERAADLQTGQKEPQREKSAQQTFWWALEATASQCVVRTSDVFSSWSDVSLIRFDCVFCRHYRSVGWLMRWLLSVPHLWCNCMNNMPRPSTLSSKVLIIIYTHDISYFYFFLISTEIKLFLNRSVCLTQKVEKCKSITQWIYTYSNLKGCVAWMNLSHLDTFHLRLWKGQTPLTLGLSCTESGSFSSGIQKNP